jgi:hypothetical protein
MERVYLAGDIVEGVKVSDTALCYVEPMLEVPVYHRCFGAHHLVVKRISKVVSVLVIYEKVLNGT